MITDVNEIRKLTHEFNEKAKAEGFAPGGSITVRGDKINVKFYTKRTQREWEAFCKHREIVLDKTLEY